MQAFTGEKCSASYSPGPTINRISAIGSCWDNKVLIHLRIGCVAHGYSKSIPPDHCSAMLARTNPVLVTLVFPNQAINVQLYYSNDFGGIYTLTPIHVQGCNLEIVGTLR